MPRCTLREYLTYKNPATILRSPITPSLRDAPESWPIIEGWQQWKDFDMDGINILFGRVLDLKFDLAEPPKIPNEQLYIRDERTFEFIVSRWNNAIVNEAIRAASEHLGLERVCWIVGSLVHPSEDATESDIRPDWAAVTSGLLADPRRMSSLVPGDTKFAKEPFNISPPGSSTNNKRLDEDRIWGSSPLGPAEKSNREYLVNCLRQVEYYALRYQTRYCYVISNKQLLIIRRMVDQPTTPSTSLAHNRGQRQFHTREVTPSPMPRQPNRQILIESSPPSQPSVLSSPYTDHGRPEVNMAHPDLLSVAWDQTKGLSINMALFALHMLAGLACDVRDDYPDISKDPDYVSRLIPGKSQNIRKG